MNALMALVAMMSNDTNCCKWFENSPNLLISQRLEIVVGMRKK